VDQEALEEGIEQGIKQEQLQDQTNTVVKRFEHSRNSRNAIIR